MIGAQALASTCRNMIWTSGWPIGTRRFDVLLLLDGEHGPAHDAGERRHVDDRDRDDHVVDPRSQDRHDPDGQQEPGEGEEDVDQSHHDLIDPAAVIAGRQPEADADHEGDDDRQNADAERHPGADQHPAEVVPAEFVGAEQWSPLGGFNLMRNDWSVGGWGTIAGAMIAITMSIATMISPASAARSRSNRPPRVLPETGRLTPSSH